MRPHIFAPFFESSHARAQHSQMNHFSRSTARYGAALAAGAVTVLGMSPSAPVLNDAAQSDARKIVALSPGAPSLDRVALTNVSPLDGRYARTTASLCHYFSEFSYMKYRTQVEIEYFIALHDVLPQLAQSPLSVKKTQQLREVYTKFSIEDGNKIKATEKITNHDVKAVEYFVKVVQTTATCQVNALKFSSMLGQARRTGIIGCQGIRSFRCVRVHTCARTIFLHTCLLFDRPQQASPPRMSTTLLLLSP